MSASWLFRPEMIAALLAGKKTQTRRVITPLNSWFDGGSWPRWAKDDLLQFAWGEAAVDVGSCPEGSTGGPHLLLPRYALGEHGVYSSALDTTVHRVFPRTCVTDLVWVRERHAMQISVQLLDGPTRGRVVFSDGFISIHDLEAHKLLGLEKDPDEAARAVHWRPSIHLPMWASRLTLEVVGVRAQRLREIALEDVEAEGVPVDDLDSTDEVLERFAALWDSINFARGLGWVANPWVYAYEFRVHHCNIHSLIDERQPGVQDVHTTKEERNADHQ